MSGVAREVISGGGVSELAELDGEGGRGFRIGGESGGESGRDRFGDYGVGDISRLIDELMRSEPGVRGAPPASSAAIGELEEFTYDASTAAAAGTSGATGEALVFVHRPLLFFFFFLES
jgi:hypothetical protein